MGDTKIEVIRKVAGSTRTTPIKKAQRGRPPTGNALSVTERGKLSDKAWVQAGGRILGRTRLSKEVAEALALLVERAGGQRRTRQVVEQAILEAAAKAKGG